MMRFVLAASAFCLLAAPARADVIWWTYHLRQLECTNSGGGYPLEVAINGCNMIIRSNNATGVVRAAAFRHRGDAYRDLGDLDRAHADYTQALRYDATMAAAYARRGDVRLRRGDYAGAEQDFVRVMEFWQESSTGPRGLCHARAALGRLDEARADCQEALRRRPTDTNARAALGLLRLRQGDDARAWEDFDDALFNRPDEARFRYGRGVAALRLGRVEEGQADISAATAADAEIAAIFAREGVTP